MTSFKDISSRVKALARKTQDEHTIVQLGNIYQVLNRFEIRPSGRNTWTVYDEFVVDEPEFNSVKNALAYCMAVNGDRRQLAHEILSLDNKYHQKQFDVQNKLFLLKNHDMDPEVRAILVVKLDEDIKFSKHLKMELQKRLNWAKYIKVKGSHYEFTGLNTSCD